MEITFTRGEKRTYTTQARREDGVQLKIPSYDRISPLPHDLAHCIVERELGLTQGFWGCIAEGALFPGIEVLSGRQPPHAAERSQAIIRAAVQHGTEAEVLVGALLHLMHEGAENNAPVVRAALSHVWRPNKPARDLPTIEEVERICLALRNIEQQWQALEVGQSLTLTWTLDKHRKR